MLTELLAMAIYMRLVRRFHRGHRPDPLKVMNNKI